MLLSVLCRSGNQTPGFDWTKSWMKIHCKEQKKGRFPPSSPAVKAADTNCRLSISNLQGKEPRGPQRGHTEQPNQPSTEANPGRSCNELQPHLTLLCSECHKLSPLRSQHSRDHPAKRKWDRQHSIPARRYTNCPTPGKHKSPSPGALSSRAGDSPAGFPAELTAAGNICFLYKHQRPISHRAAQNSPLATHALLLHTLSPLYDYRQSQKGSTRMQHSYKPAGELLKLGCPVVLPQGAHLAVLVYRLL